MLTLGQISNLKDIYTLLKGAGDEAPLPKEALPLINKMSCGDLLSECIWRYTAVSASWEETFLSTTNKVRLYALRHLLYIDTHACLLNLLHSIQNHSLEKTISLLDHLSLVDHSLHKRLTSRGKLYSIDVQYMLLDQILLEWAFESTREENRLEAATRILDYWRSKEDGLDLSGLGLTTLPAIFGPELEQFNYLQILNLERNELTSLPGQIFQLPNLRTLALNHNPLVASLPPVKNWMDRLQKEWLWIVAALDDWIRLEPTEKGREAAKEAITTYLLDDDQNLYLYSLGLTSLPDIFDSMLFLKTTGIALSRNQLTALPNSLTALTQLAFLYLDSNKLSLIPRGLTTLPRLENLKLEGNPLTARWGNHENWVSFLQYTHLSVVVDACEKNDLRLVQQCLEEINSFAPTTIQRIRQHPSFLNFSNLTSLAPIIAEIFALQVLTGWVASSTPGEQRDQAKLWMTVYIRGDSTQLTLNLSKLALKTLPDIFHLPQFKRLIFLQLQENQLSELPPSFKHLTGLVKLDLSDNNLDIFPDLTPLSELKVLALQGNKICHIPEKAIHLPYLEILTLNNTPLTTTFGPLRNWAPFLPLFFLYSSSTFTYPLPLFANLKSDPLFFKKIRPYLANIAIRAANYTKDLSRDRLKKLLRSLLAEAEKNPVFRGLFLSIVDEAQASCIDGLTLSVVHLQLARLQLNIDLTDLQGAFDALTKIHIFHLLEGIAKAKIQSLKDAVDVSIMDGTYIPTQDQIDTGDRHIHIKRVEREIYLIYPAKLGAEFDLPIDVTEMLFASLTQVTEADLEAAKRAVTEILSDQKRLHHLLIENATYLSALKLSNPAKVRAIECAFSEDGDLEKRRNSLSQLSLATLAAPLPPSKHRSILQHMLDLEEYVSERECLTALGPLGPCVIAEYNLRKEALYPTLATDVALSLDTKKNIDLLLLLEIVHAIE